MLAFKFKLRCDNLSINESDDSDDDDDYDEDVGLRSVSLLPVYRLLLLDPSLDVRLLQPSIDREFEFYEFFSFLKFNEFYYFFRLKKTVKIRNFANHRCLTCFDVLECNVHL